MTGEHFVTAARPAPSQRERVLDAAIAQGKFPARRRAHYEALYARDPEGTRALIARLASVPEITNDAAKRTPDDSYPRAWLPEVNPRGR